VEVQLRREAKRRKQLAEKLERQRLESEEWETWQRRGELLKGVLGELRRGMTSIEVTDWFDLATPRIRIELDAARTPQENIERCFRRARKGKRSLPSLEERCERLAQERREIELLRHDLERTEGADGGSEDALVPIERAEAWLATHARLRRAQGSRTSDPSPGGKERRAPASRRRAKRETVPGGKSGGPTYRRFRTREGLEILAGRNARQNDELSIRVARGNDLFFHRADRPGPHVILRVPRGRVASPESIDDAAFVAAYLSGWRGPSDARVHWTEAKHVRKPRGLPPGRVLAHRTRDHRVRFDRERIGGLSALDPPPARPREEEGGRA